MTIFVANHGYHTGLALPRSAVAGEAGERGYAALINVAARFGAYPWLEIGWGEEEFYREVPTARSFSAGLALRALFMPGNRSVMHVVGLMNEPQRIFPLSEVVPARLSERGFRQLLEAVNRSFALKDGLPKELGRGLYGPSLFFRATGTFNLLNVCNHWAGRMLATAGLPYWPVLATVPPGVLWAVPR